MVEIAPKIGYQDIHRLIEQNRFSEEMGYCGQQGFNFTEVEPGDLDTVQALTDPIDGGDQW